MGVKGMENLDNQFPKHTLVSPPTTAVLVVATNDIPDKIF